MSSRRPTDSNPDEDTVGYRSPALDEARAEIVQLKRQASAGGDEDKTRYYDPEESRRVERADGEGGDPRRRRRPSWPARDRDTPAQDADAAARGGDGEHTRLYNPAKADRAAAADKPPVPKGGTPSAGHSADDPVVGWLVVVSGPGKGKSLEIGVGANAIGRDSRQKIRVDFGDKHISRDKHAVMIYEPHTRKYFVQGGDVRNLTYIGSDLVLNPTELRGGEVIVVGETHLCFVPFDESNYS